MILDQKHLPPRAPAPVLAHCNRLGERLSWKPTGFRGRDGVARVALLLDASEPGADRTTVLFEGDEGPDQRLGYVYGPARSILAWCASNGIKVR